MAVAHPDEAVREDAKLCEPKIDSFTTGALARRQARRRHQALRGEEGAPLERRARAAPRRRAPRLPPQRARSRRRRAKQRLRELNEEITKLGLRSSTSNLAESHLIARGRRRRSSRGCRRSTSRRTRRRATARSRSPPTTPTTSPSSLREGPQGSRSSSTSSSTNRAADKNVAVLEQAPRAPRREGEAPRLRDVGRLRPRAADGEGRRRRSPRSSRACASTSRRSGRGRARRVQEGAREARRQGDRHDPAVRPPLPRGPGPQGEVRARLEGGQQVLRGPARSRTACSPSPSKLFGIRYQPGADAPTWHPDVEAMEVTDASGKLLGRFYFDLYPRDGKYKHAAVFSIRDTAKMPRRLAPRCRSRRSSATSRSRAAPRRR